MGLVEQLREGLEHAILDLAPTEIEHHASAVLAERALEDFTGVVQTQLAPQAQPALPFVLEALDAHTKTL